MPYSYLGKGKTCFCIFFRWQIFKHINISFAIQKIPSKMSPIWLSIFLHILPKFWDFGIKLLFWAYLLFWAFYPKFSLFRQFLSISIFLLRFRKFRVKWAQLGWAYFAKISWFWHKITFLGIFVNILSILPQICPFFDSFWGIFSRRWNFHQNLRHPKILQKI